MEHKFSTPGGSYLKTPDTVPDTEILKDSESHYKKRYEYSNGLIFITDKDKKTDTVHINSNYKWSRNLNGEFYPVYSSPNPDFVDEHVQ